MDTSADLTANNEESKKNSFDECNREELVKKCKGLLAIAHKAKQAKQELQLDFDAQKEQLSQALADGKRDKESARTLQELVESLTEQKLTYITELDATRGRQAALATQLQEAQGKASELERQVGGLNERLQGLDSECVSLKRLKQRLENENEELIGQLSQLEAAAVEQRQQLHVVEDSIDKASPKDKNESEDEIQKLNEIISSLEKQLQTKGDDLLSKQNELQLIGNELTEHKQKYETERERREKANSKLKSYREKLIKCSSCITQLKNAKIILIKTVKDYSESIPKWQDEMVKLSKIITKQFNEISTENKAIKQQIADYENNLLVLKQGIKQLQKENSDLSNRNEELQQATKDKGDESNNEQLSLHIKALESEKLILLKEKQTARDTIIEMEAQTKKFQSDVKILHSNIETLEAKINFLECENVALKDKLKDKDTKQCSELKDKLKMLQTQFDALKIENTNIIDLNNLLREEVDTLKSSLERPSDDGENLSDLNVSLQTDIMKLETKLSAYKQENSSLLADMKEMRAKLKEMSANNADYEEVKAKMIGYKTENAELLNEMKEVNQVLKERGESISKQEKAIAEMERLIDTFEKDRERITELNKTMEKQVRELEEQVRNLSLDKNNQEDEIRKMAYEQETVNKILEEKDSTIALMKDEVERLKQNQISSIDHPNEDMSTSTISRVEEHNRMKELDDSFEEKYTKLRIFALKLKKKANELSQQLEEAEAEKAKLQKLLSETTVIVRTSDLQDSVLNKTDEEKESNDNKDAGDENNKASGEPIEDVLDRVQMAQLNSGQTVDEAVVNDLRSRVEQLTAQLAEIQTSPKDVDMENLKVELSKKELALATEIEQHRATKDNLEKVRKDVKKKSVLSLEMEDYERSMKDLTVKMEENKKKTVQMESTIDTQQGTINSLKIQIKMLEEQVAAEENQNKELREELHEVTESVKEKEALVEAKNDIILRMEMEMENGKRLYEDLNVEMATLVGEKEKLVLSLSHDKAELGRRLKRAETQCGRLEESARVTAVELEDLKTEFALYKVRAQAVLRQNQTTEPGAEERLRDELLAARACQQSLRAQLEAAKAELEEAQSACAGERRRAAEGAAEAARGQQRAARLAADLQRLTQQLDTERAQAKLQVTTLTQCYKSQTAELEAQLERAAAELRAQAERAPRSPPQDDGDAELDLNVAMLPREEGEGSESAPSPPLTKQWAEARAPASRSPVPLARLLEDGVPDEDAADGCGIGLTADQELADLRRKLHAQMQRAEHTTLLLAEAERECARHAQLAELLKAELRRARGSALEHNAQYTKNVTLKFLTLPAGDERSRLVPVLQKLLTLSLEETHTLSAIARGQEPGGKGGWGSYLPWSGK